MQPTMSAASLDGALALYRAGRVQEALAEGHALVRRHPGDARAHHLVGMLLMALGRAGDAISSLKAASRLQPENIQPRLQLALALHQMGRLEEAGVSYRRVLAWSPSAGDAHCNLGLIESAARRMARAVTLSPDNPSMLSNLGALTGSQRLLKRALALAPGEGGIHLSLGNQRRTEGSLESASVAYRRARDCGRPGEAMANLALAASDLGHSDEALRWMRCSIAFTPSEPFILSNAAQIAKGRGWLAAAIDLARRSLACAATAEAWNNLGDSLQATGDVGGALAAYRRSVELGGSAAWHSNLVFCLCYDERVTSEALFAEVHA
ncbi:MAG: tetratricopeptide repeat protein, partial [Rhodospirillaceae bacterium]|nr:tetratricopeptide repeat protein [Rhodospirillaceae bacterium]